MINTNDYKEAINNAPKGTIAIEVSKSCNDFNYWNTDRIKGAFKAGNGSLDDLRKYFHRNKQYIKPIYL